MKTVNVIILAVGMFWLGLIFAAERVGEVIWLGLAGTAGLLLAFAASELVGRGTAARRVD
jgi:hypothetical protein